MLRFRLSFVLLLFHVLLAYDMRFNHQLFNLPIPRNFYFDVVVIASDDILYV